MANSGVNVKMGVTGIAQFRQDINTAKYSLKTLGEQLELNEKQFKATGDKEAYMQQKAELLKVKLEEQKSIASQAEAALKQMTSQGVDKASKAFQDMQQQLLKAKGDMLDTEAQLKNVGESGEKAGTAVDKMNDNLKDVGKGVAWENVTNGLGKIIDKLEDGARAAVNLGKKIARSAMDSTQWADEILTEATKYGTDAETIQRMRNVAEFIDTDVDTILNAKARLAKNKDNLGDMLGLDAGGMTVEEAFWRAGEAISAMTDEWEREDAAQKIFGRGWRDLVPLFTKGQEEYNRLMAEQNVLTNDQVNSLGEADDAIKSVQQQLELMKNQFWAENADKIIELGQWIVDNKDGIVKALTAIAGGFAALKLGEAAMNIAKVVNGFKTLWNGAGNPLPDATGLGGGNGSSVLQKVGSAAGSAASTFGMAGGVSVAAPVAIMGAGAYAGAKMIEANMNDPLTNKIYGDNESKDLLDRLTESQLRLAMDYEKVWNDPEKNGTEEAFAARDALYEALEQGGIEMTEDAVQFLEDIWDERERGMDIDGLVAKYERLTDDLTGGTDAQRQSSSDMSSAAGTLKGMPGLVESAILRGMSQIKIFIDGATAGQVLTPYVNSNIGGILAGITRP